ncbi:hypothetical protein [Acinetobacter wuhouensis]|uniref:Uncharacterized protein n=1 Tax=Acinetobacter wuhouensis TaxID=1879050 RepID=A0A3G2T2W4_9GAMM|nr:hypothetical protein [Acinetobacter wuhouensis]AYO54421.1 hypothetical protein CDG68_12575 [Acinetobacter wuhouensis]
MQKSKEKKKKDRAEKVYQEELKKKEAQNAYNNECAKIRNEIDQHVSSLIKAEIQPKLKKGFYESVISCIILGSVVGVFAGHIIGWGVFGAIVGYFIYIFDKNKQELNLENKYLKYKNISNDLEKLKKIKRELSIK